ncbi:hypothetical protein ACH5RR_013419 [Cinchona calisaya]|uniref:Protein FAR1-RELATED SEQUENCE n=1 Tax=Cinchona calisaya TaxID=153742 RepID=A0ABD3A3M1_9GENT
MDTEPDLQSPSRIRGKRNADGHWKLVVQNESHNHEAYKDLAGHPFARVFLEEEVQDIDNLNRNHASFRAEGAHSKLKQYLLVSTGDIVTVKGKICHLIENEIHEFKVKILSEKLQVPHKCNIPFFKEVVTRLSLFSLKELEKQFELMENHTMQPICSGSFMAIMGLPCAHMMCHWRGQTLPLAMVHSQWRIDTRETLLSEVEATDDDCNLGSVLTRLKDEHEQWPLADKENAQARLSQLIASPRSLSFEPKVQRGKGRQPSRRKRKGSSSTVRDPSQFERIEAAQKHKIHEDFRADFQPSQIASNTMVEDQLSSFAYDSILTDRFNLNII